MLGLVAMQVTEARRIFGLDPTAAVLVATAVLVVVVLALVAMSMGSRDEEEDEDAWRRPR